jgi:glycosyltransferase involved in cell wall biosynthesis
MEPGLRGLSVVIIARNAEKTIGECLQSVSPIADEIIVVTNDCLDDTKNISEMYGATVVDHKWEGFRNQKNFAIGLAKKEWILSLDADEALSERLKKSIADFIASSPNHVGAKIARKTLFLSKWIVHGDWYPDYSIRLFRNGRGRFVGGSVHERVEVDGEVKCLIGDILHYPCTSLAEFTKRNIDYADWAARDMFNRGERISVSAAIFRSHWRFLRSYVFRLGFLDKAAGYYAAKTQSFFTLYKYFRLHNLANNE